MHRQPFVPCATASVPAAFPGNRGGWRSLLYTIFVAFAAVALPASAQAHVTAPGMNHFTSGLLHPWMTPTHLIILLALGLWLGQNVPLRLGLPLKVFAPLSAAALAFTTTRWIAGVPPPILAAIALAAGAVVALEARLPSPAGAVLLAAAAVAIGSDSGADTGTPLAIAGTLLGTWVSLGLGLVNIAYYTSLAAERKKKWIGIGLRIAGSWIVAISLLMLAFSLRRGNGEGDSKGRTSNTQHPTPNIQWRKRVAGACPLLGSQL